MNTTQKRKPKPCSKAKLFSDPKLLLPKLRVRLAKELTSLERWRKRLARAFHAFERQHRLVARLGRRIAKLESV